MEFKNRLLLIYVFFILMLGSVSLGFEIAGLIFLSLTVIVTVFWRAID